MAFDTQSFDISYFDKNTTNVDNQVKLLWDQAGSVDNLVKLLWDQKAYSDGYVKLLWDNKVYVDNYVKLLWDNRISVDQSVKLLWDQTGSVSNAVKLLWDQIGVVDSSVQLVWREAPSITLFSDSRGYLEVVTPQGSYLYPRIRTGKISIQQTTDTATFDTLDFKDYIPEDSLVRFYLNNSVKLFEGRVRKTTLLPEGFYRVSVSEYSEILKPEPPKGGLYLVKNTWHNVQLQYLLSSNKPSDNNNTLGLLYMASSNLIGFVEHDQTHYIYKLEYEGIVYSISEVWEDESLLTKRASLADLNSASGWYHDDTNKILYVRCTDNVHPYFHVITAPNIWDSAVPMRIGNIQNQATTVITYWDTGYGESPYDNIKLLLDALSLEKEHVMRSGICYMDIATKVGAGTSSSPASFYLEGNNLKELEEFVMSDARTSANAVHIGGYGQGAAQVVGFRHINMGRGGRFLFIDDATLHSDAMAEDYAQSYLDKAYLPARSITASVDLKRGSAIEQRRKGDYVHFSIPTLKVEQDLRIQELSIDLSKYQMSITAGDYLVSLEEQLKAMKTAAEKYLRHLSTEIEEFNWPWSDNLVSNAAKSEKFSITADAMKMQTIELSCSTQLYRDEAAKGSGSGSPGGGGGSSPDGGSSSEPSGGHTHNLVSGDTGAPSAIVSVATEGHTHVVGSGTTGSSTTGISIQQGTHPSACCTGVNCGKEFLTGVNISIGPDPGHDHTVTGLTGEPSATVAVGSDSHIHTLVNLATTTELAHSHGMPTANPYFDNSGSELEIDPVTKDVNPGWRSGLYDMVSSVPYTFKKPPGSDPEMYLTIKINGTEIDGSPFVINVEDSIGPVLVDDIVTGAGEYEVTVSLANKTTPADQCQIHFSVQVRGKIFVDTIVGS